VRELVRQRGRAARGHHDPSARHSRGRRPRRAARASVAGRARSALPVDLQTIEQLSGLAMDDVSVIYDVTVIDDEIVSGAELMKS
jgi:hypothetical protein